MAQEDSVLKQLRARSEFTKSTQKQKYNLDGIPV